MPVAHLRSFATEVLKECSAHGELCISFVGEKTIARLNRQYLHRRGTTDVISFSMDSPGEEVLGQTLIGDVVICVPRAAQDAKEEGVSLRHKLEILVLHGILHLMGYDHENGNDLKKMKAKENRIWNALRKKTAKK